jgi:hypothetical protein
MMFENCDSLVSVPELYINKFINKKKDEINDNNEKINLKGTIRNQILDVFPQIEIKFNSLNLYDSNSILFLKKEIKNLLKNINFSIIEIKTEVLQ